MTLKLKAASFFEMSVAIYQSTRYKILDNVNIQYTDWLAA
jgi:hypothetical protein